MNCSRFRFLIQQKFDLDLAPQEERIVLAHLESCESCAKFYHQLQQVILAAEEAPLPDEMLPANEEQLARMIMSQLPATKSSPFAFITNFFQKKQAPPPMEDTRVRRGPAGKQSAAASAGGDRGSAFPHRSSNAVKEVGRGSSDSSSKFRNPKEEEFSGASNRLKAMNKGFDPEAEQRELQSTTLGAKFGKAVPVAAPVESPLTLAESIRKKISEGAKPQDDGTGEGQYDDDGAGNGHDNYDDGFGSSNEQEARQPGGAPQGLQGFSQGMMQQSSVSPQMPQMAQPQGFNSAPAAPMGAPAFGAPATNANAPVVGSWGKPSTADNGNDWNQNGGAPQGIPAQQLMPPQPYLAEQPAQVAAQQPAQPAGWGSTFENAPAPQAPAPQINAQPQGGWGAPAPTGNSWNQAPVSQPAAAQAMQPQASPPAWGAPAPGQAAPAPQAPSFDATPAPATTSQGWGQGPLPAPVPAPVAPAPTTQVPNSGWNNGSGDSWDASGQRGWGQTGADAPKTVAPQVVQPAAQPAPAADGWGQPAAQAAWGQTAGSVNTTAPPAPQSPAPAPAPETPQGGWGATSPQGGWGTPAEANDWNAPKPSQVDVAAPAQAPQAQMGAAPVAPQPRPAARPAWSLESEQIETGTWQAFSPSGETLGAKSTPAPAKKAEEPMSADPLSIDDRWSTPIQSRKTSEPEQPGPATPQPMPQQGFAPPMMPPPMPTPAGYENQNYNPEAPQQGAPAWGEQPAQVQQAHAAQQQQQSLQQSVMQKLNNTLDESAGAQAGGPENSWELSIQEKLQAQQRALMGASMQQLAAMPLPPSLQEQAQAQAPAQVQAPAQTTQPNAWDAQPQNSDWNANQNIAQPQQAPNSAWGAPATAQQQVEPQPSMQQSFQPAPVAPQAEQKSSLFSLDDQAIDQLFNENLKLKNANAQAPQRVQSAEQPAPMAAPAPAPVPAWTPAPTTWAPEPPQPAPELAPAPSQFAQPPQQLQQPQVSNPQMDWSDNANSGQPKITGVNARPSMQNAAFAPGEDRRGQTGADQFAPPAMPQPAPQTVPAPQPQAQNAQGLFNLDDNAMDQLFQSNLGVEEAARTVGGSIAPPLPVPAPMPQPAMQSGNTSGGWAQPAAVPTSSGSGWASPPQSLQPAQFAQPQMPQQAQPAQNSTANPGWGAPQQQAQPPQPALPPQTLAPVQPQHPPAQPAQSAAPGGWGGQAAAGSTGWGQQQQPAAPQPRIGASGDPNKPKTGLFSIDDSVIDSIFADNLGVREGQGPKGNVNEAVAKLTDAAAQPQQQQQPGYGETNYDSPAPVKVEGVGRLDSRVDNNNDQNSGRIASIGKFLLDQKDLEKIGNITEADLSDSSMRVLTTDAASELQQLLQHIGQQRSVIGSVIIGHDGLLIANTLPPDFDAESMGQFALGIYMNTSTTVTKLGHEHIHQFVGRTPRGYIVIADFGGGLLVTISEGSETDALIPLMRSITQLVAQ